jgi:hypothetical protein
MVSARQIEPLYRIAEVARMLHVSRGTVYNLLRGSRIVNFRGKGGKGVKLVPESVLLELLERNKKVYR